MNRAIMQASSHSAGLFFLSVPKEGPEARSFLFHFSHYYIPSSVIAQGRPLELPIRPGQLRQTHRESLGGNYSDPWKFAESRTEPSMSRMTSQEQAGLHLGG